MCMMFSQCNICSMGIYLTIQYQGECGHIEGHTYFVLPTSSVTSDIVMLTISSGKLLCRNVH